MVAYRPSCRFIQAVHLTEKSCPEMADDGLSSFDTNQSRSQVNFNVEEEKPDCAIVQPTKGHTMLQLDGTCATEVVAGELVEKPVGSGEILMDWWEHLKKEQIYHLI